MARFDVAIVGLGAMGSAAAWHLARRGARVVGIDSHRPPHHFGSSHGLTRIIRAAYFEAPHYVPLVRRAYELWDALSAESNEPLLHRVGGLSIGPPDAPVVAGAQRSAAEHGVAVTTLGAAEVRARIPALAPTDSMIGIFEPGAGLVLPERAIELMLDNAARSGATLVYNTSVSGWEATTTTVRIATPTHDYEASRLILAAGAWTSGLLTGVPLPLTVERAVQFWLQPADPVACGPDRLPVFILEYEPGRLLYGLPDIGDGVKLALHHGGELTTADTVRRTVGEEERAHLRDLAQRWVPAAAGPIVDARVCLYTNTPDGDFVIDLHPAHPNVVVASPCSGHGFKFAPAIGEVLADLVTGAVPSVDLVPFRIARFVRP